jgi:hypothetical protein
MEERCGSACRAGSTFVLQSKGPWETVRVLLLLPDDSSSSHAFASRVGSQSPHRGIGKSRPGLRKKVADRPRRPPDLRGTGGAVHFWRATYSGGLRVPAGSHFVVLRDARPRHPFRPPTGQPFAPGPHWATTSS